MNIITIAGKLGNDAEVKYLPDGTAVSSFSVADDQGKNKPTIWWRCQLFGKRADSLSPYLTKGQSVTVSGEVTEREYTNKDGAKVKAQDIRVNNVALQGGGKQTQDDGHAPAPKGYQAPAPRARPQPNFSDMDDDIPFLLSNIGMDTSTVSKRLIKSKLGRSDNTEF